MAKPLNRPFGVLRTLKQKAAEAEAEAARVAKETAAKSPPEDIDSFADAANADGVERAEQQPTRVAPPMERAQRAVHRDRPREYAFSVRVDAGVVEARRDDTELVVFSWLARQEPQRTLDLHGQDAESARRSVHRFVRARHKRGDDVVLIVTGVGRGTQGAGVLKSDAPEWLAERCMHVHVRAFATAPQRFGGGGALIVLLATAT